MIMRYINMKATLVAVLAVLVLSCMALPASAQMDDNYRHFQSWDENNNERLTHQEFHEGISEINMFDAWDEDDSGYLNKDELQSGIYKKWERLGENFKDRAEARATVWTRYYAGTFDDWDLDGDGTITNEEYNQQVGRDKHLQIGQKMDANRDGRIDELEFYSTIFSMWDDDSNGYLTQDEFDPDEFESWFL